MKSPLRLLLIVLLTMTACQDTKKKNNAPSESAEDPAGEGDDPAEEPEDAPILADCEGFTHRAIACNADLLNMKEQLITLCKEENQGDREPILRCALKGRCWDFKQCRADFETAYKDGQTGDRVEKRMADLNAAINKPDHTEVLKTCRTFRWEQNEKLQRACFAGVRAAMLARRDADNPAGASELAALLAGFGKPMHGDIERAGRTLGEELATLEDIHRTRADLKNATAGEVVYRCKSAIEKLAELDTPWAKTQLKDLTTACDGHTATDNSSLKP